MGGICGWYGAMTAPDDAGEVIRRMAQPLARFDGSEAMINIGSRHAVAVSGKKEHVHLHADRDACVAIWGSIGFAESTLAAASSTRGPGAALLQAFRAQGVDCLQRVRGTFAIALTVAATGEGLLAVDRMGTYGLVFARIGDGIIFGSNADAIHLHPQCRPSPDWQSIYNYVHFHMVPGPATAFCGEQRLLPGEYLHCRDSRATTGRYWQIHFVESEERPFAELREEFTDVLTRAVRASSAREPTGAFLSGGTDSSTVSGLLCRTGGKPAATFSIGFAEAGYDEISYARIAAGHFKTDHHEYYVTPQDIVETIPKLGILYDQPFGNSSAVPTYCCARLARQAGISHLVAGDGGDELFGGNERYATQYLYSLYQKLPTPIRESLIQPAAQHLPGTRWIPPLRWIRRFVQIAATPMPDRLETYNLLRSFRSSAVFTPEFLGQVDVQVPLAMIRDTYHQARAGSLINRMLAFDLKFTLADNDLPKVVRSCELAGASVGFPMLDDDVVAFSARLAPHLKLKGTKLRYFFKEALRGFLPEAIITKKKHGFGLPFGRWLVNHPALMSIVESNLQQLRQRGIIKAEFITELTSSRLSEHPAYYGTMVWILVMLEQWFRNHAQAATP